MPQFAEWRYSPSDVALVDLTEQEQAKLREHLAILRGLPPGAAGI
jgi:hypothetical protein